MKKYILSLALAFLLCLNLVPVFASAANSDFVIQDIDIEGKHFTNVLTAYNGPGGNVIIPEGVRYVGLGIGWENENYGHIFAGREDITSVTIPEGAVAIGGGAFAGCTGLTSVTIPDSMQEITNSAFSGCSGLTSVTIPGSVQRIATGAFSGCTGLTSLTLCDGVGTIGGEAFRGCTSLTSVSFPASANVGAIAFLDCTSLTDITVQETTVVAGSAFDGTPWQAKQGDWVIVNGTLLAYQGTDTNIVIPNTVTSIGGGWYHDVGENISSVTIPHSVTKIDDNAFWHLTGLTSIEIPDSVTYIGGRAFANTGLISVTIPDSVTTIGNAAFEECNNLTDIVIPSSVTEIDTSKRGIPAFDRAPNVTIHGSAGSYAETYAKEHNIPFVADLSPKVGGFNDVRETDYYADAVLWAVDKGITSGTSATTFSPDTTCTTAQILTFLWRANGSPAPTINNPFSDVTAGAYYADAAVWAYEKGLISGSVFGGDTPATRAATVTYLWKLAGSPSASSAAFTDVPSTADFAQAVAWAVDRSITSGTSATTFSPSATCTRSQIVTFLWRTYK